MPTIPYDSVWKKSRYKDLLFTVLYAQVSCTASEEFLQSKLYWALACTCIGALMCLFFRFTMIYLGRINKINAKLLDLEIISIEDYSVRGKISHEFYN